MTNLTVSAWVLYVSGTYDLPGQYYGRGDILTDGDLSAGQDFQLGITSTKAEIVATKGGYSLSTVLSLEKNISNAWTHVTWVMTTSGSAFYVNGLQVFTTSTGGANVGLHAPPLIGANASQSLWTAFFGGKIDDIRVYNRALTPQEVTQLHELEFPDGDRDGLNDYEELNVYHTDPTKKDSDNDGLNDYSEVRVFNTDPLKPDTDGDGYNDYPEIYAGKNPNDINDHPAASLSAFTAIELEFITQTGQVYQIQSSTDLTNWTNFGEPIQGDGNIWTKVYPTRGQVRTYYRVELAP